MKAESDQKGLRVPRCMIAAASSGSGKTSITMGLLRLLSRKGHAVHPFKTGPDYIDPGHLELAAGKPCRNLDPFLMGHGGMMDSFIRPLALSGESSETGAAESNKQIAVVEGVMGLYDGRSASGEGSSAELAKMLGLPVIVILDAAASAGTVGAVALGMKLYDPEVPVAGFIANRIGSPGHYGMVKEAVEGATGLPLLGYLPKRKDVAMPERHLGLVGAWEDASPLLKVVETVADLLEEHLDLDRLLAVAAAAPSLEKPAPDPPGREPFPVRPMVNGVRIALARDEAFCFYYRDNLEILQLLGAELVPFSPLGDQVLPEGISGIYFGGGYPELHAETLANNQPMLEAIRGASQAGMPIYGECGGLMYLVKTLSTRDGSFSMAGLFNLEIEMGRNLSALGYYQGQSCRDTLIGPSGTSMKGHIYRWSRIRTPGDPGNFGDTGGLEPREAELPVLELQRRGEISHDGFAVRNSYAGYLHVHFAGSPEPARNFLRAAEAFQDGTLLQ